MIRFATALFLACAASAGAEVRGPIEIAPAALRSEWARRFEQAESLTVRHDETWPHAAPFRSARRSEILQHDRYVDGRIRTDAALVAFLAKALRTPGRKLAASCPDTLAKDEIVVGFGKGKDAIMATFAPRSGSLEFTDSQSRQANVYPGPDCVTLLHLLAHAIPKDFRLAKIEPCTSRVSGAPSNLVSIDSMPVPLKTFPPDYPDIARQSRMEGTVVLQALIDEKGEVARTVVTRSIPVMEDCAVRAVEQWRFKPAMSNGKPIAVWVEIPVAFRLQ